MQKSYKPLIFNETFLVLAGNVAATDARAEASRELYTREKALVRHGSA